MNSDIKSSDTIRYLCKGGCKKEKTIPDFGKKPNGDIYKQCIECRENRTNKRPVTEDIIMDVNDISNNEGLGQMEDKKKRENRPSISTQKQQSILKEQDYMCRGPCKNDNNEYECDMKVNGKKFSDRKASEPQFDHIIRWKEGGNGIGNIQALCASCHLMKTSMENLINDDNNAMKCPRIKVIYDSLTKEKYKESTIDESSDESSEDELFIPRHPIIRTNTRVRRTNRRYV